MCHTMSFELSQDALVRACRGMYWAYLASPPFWVATCVWELRKQRDASIKTEMERARTCLFLLYAVFDQLRCVDLCFATDHQLADGACRSMWGMQPLWARAAAWWARDMTMLAGLGFFLQFTLRWTHAATGLQAPRILLGRLRLLILALALGMSGCALMLLASNRLAWIFGLLVLVVCLNATSCHAAWIILDRLSEIRRVPRSPGPDPGLEALERVVVLEAAVMCRTLLALALVVLGIFIPVSLPRLLDGGLRWPLVRGPAQGAWVGGTRFPALAALASEAPGVLPNPCVEGAELAIGWGLCACLLLSRLRAGRAEKPARAAGRWLSAEELGAAVRGMLARKAE